jgi:hypothetical protein
MDTWFNASGGGGGQKITIDGSVLKDMKCTIKESWLNVGEIPTPPRSDTLLNAKSKGWGNPVELDGYLYGIIRDGSKSPIKDQLVKFDEKGYEVVCNMPYTDGRVNYFCKYKGNLYTIYRYHSSSPSFQLGEIWKFNPDTKSFTKVATSPIQIHNIFGAIEYAGDLHFFINTVVSSSVVCQHYKFNGTSITLVTNSSPFTNISTLYGVRDGYLYAFYSPNSTQSEEVRFFKRFNGTSWSDYSTPSDFVNKLLLYDETLPNIPFLIDDNHFMYLPRASTLFIEVTSGNTYKNSIIAPYYWCSGVLLIYKGKLTFLSGYSRPDNNGGNGSYSNFFVREKILCLEG